MSLTEDDKRWITDLLDEKIEKLRASLHSGGVSEEDRNRHLELGQKIEEIVRMSSDLAQRTKKMNERP